MLPVHRCGFSKLISITAAIAQQQNIRKVDFRTYKSAANDCPQQLQPKDGSVDSTGDDFLPPGVKSSSAKGIRRLAFSNIFVGPTSGRTQVGEAEFIKSSADEQDCPRNGLPEFAFVGRSNVGKSSLINALVRRKNLAKTSKTPGKTQLINHFLIDKSWYLVDLPGYGYANVPVNVRMDWDNFTKNYFLKRKTLVSVLLLVDASLPPKKTDLSYADWLNSHKIPLTLVFTKCDKRRTRNTKQPDKNVQEFLRLLKENFNEMPPWIMTSCTTKQGTAEVLIHLAHLRDYWKR